MEFTGYIESKAAFVFELDDVLYPEKDYWLQVYYLFAQFIEYSELTAAAPIVSFMQEEYAREGRTGMFEKTAAHFNLPAKYKENFDLLQQNAKLPLKLLLFAPMLDFLQAIKAAEKPIYLLLEGHPGQQLNKIRQMEWNGLETYLKVYFAAEMTTGYDGALETILLDSGYDPKEILVVGKPKSADNLAKFNIFEFLTVDKFL